MLTFGYKDTSSRVEGLNLNHESQLIDDTSHLKNSKAGSLKQELESLKDPYSYLHFWKL